MESIHPRSTTSARKFRRWGQSGGEKGRLVSRCRPPLSESEIWPAAVCPPSRNPSSSSSGLGAGLLNQGRDKAMAKKSDVEKRTDLAEDLSEACEVERDLGEVIKQVGASLERSEPLRELSLSILFIYNSPAGERHVSALVPARVVRKRILPALRLAVADAANRRVELVQKIGPGSES
jgi:hypothetical protein